MIAAAQDKIRLIEVTAGNLRHNHLSVTGLHGFLPRGCFGGANRKSAASRPIRIQLEGLARTVETDIACEAKTGKPRRQLRGRSWVKDFFRHHGIHSGDLLELERRDEWTYSLRVASPCGQAPNAPLRFAEFFAGIGLVRLALERHGFQTVFANDIDPDKFEIYSANFGADHFHLGDIHKLNALDVPQCHLFTASFPCNDLSIAGAWEGLNGKESSAFWGLVRILEDLEERRPPMVMLENVLGFLQSNQGKDFETALLALCGLGYTVDAFILNAAHWVPQSRARLFVVAKKNPVESRNPFAMVSDARPEALVEFINLHPNIRWDIRNLPKLPKPTARLRDIIQNLPDDDAHWWNKDRCDYFFGQLSPRHLQAARTMMAETTHQYATAFRRVRHGRSMAELRTDGIAGCLRTPRGGSGRQILFRAGNGRYQVRLLTARECARLQGVPDSYKIEGIPLNQALFGFGDAVCVPAVAWIAKHYLNPLATGMDHEGPLLSASLAK
jgi:DNA (cytosine-5)-methyltransferase 1